MQLREKISTLFNNKWTIWYIIISLVLFIGIGYYIYQTYVQPKIKPTYVENRELIPDEESVGVQLYIFHTLWCPHSKKIMDEEKGVWSKIKKEIKKVNNYNIKYIEINGDDEKAVKNWESKYKKQIEGFPTIILIKDEQVIEFDANPTHDTLTNFLNTVI